VVLRTVRDPARSSWNIGGCGGGKCEGEFRKGNAKESKSG